MSSHGYDYPADGFGNRGVALPVKAGGQGQIKVHRVNVAERLYRTDRRGHLPGQRPGRAAGPDPASADGRPGHGAGHGRWSTPYQGKIYWFFGDTERPAYPARSVRDLGGDLAPAGQGGLNPDSGLDLTYWVDGDGFSKKMMPLPGFGGPVWVGGVFTLNDAGGDERLYTHFTQLDGQGKAAEHGLAVFNDAKALFEPVSRFALDAPSYPEGQPFHAVADGQPYLYFQSKETQAFPLARVRADGQHAVDASALRDSPASRPARGTRARTRNWTGRRTGD